MTKLEIACVICGLIGMVLYQPTHIRFGKENFANIIMVILIIIKGFVFLAMIILPLYFRLWRK